MLARDKVTVTSVLTAAHGNDANAIYIMRNLANRTKGRFYKVDNPRALPRIYQKEARTISRPLIFEQGTPWLPKVNMISEPISGLTGDVPPITGLVLTSVKEKRVGRIADRVTFAWRSNQPGLGSLDVWPRKVGRVHLGRWP